jgi:hypothetical protein
MIIAAPSKIDRRGVALLLWGNRRLSPRRVSDAEASALNLDWAFLVRLKDTVPKAADEWLARISQRK